ncbi:unnamed protein product [Miscanthus lutarioriparius]|uniref:Uncharacterized protein n=1 Tax=Miscanthus lutarioriparius TaxID=422564 RepID=A0A811R938_9POAL|nr:unnamed protein product [Miscanthus lutarioriparius]
MDGADRKRISNGPSAKLLKAAEPTASARLAAGGRPPPRATTTRGGIRGAASDSDSLKESVRTLTQEQTSRDTKKAFWMPSPRTSAGRQSGLPQQPAAAAAGAPWATVRAVPDEARAGGRRPRSPPRRKAKGTHRGKVVEEEEEVLAAARVDDMLRGQGRRRRLGLLLPLLALGLWSGCSSLLAPS